MSSRPKVSIIFPFYNCEEFIKEALLSIEHLPPEDFEIIAINDGSTDRSYEIVQEVTRAFSMEGILIDSSPNRGCFEARTSAIAASSGKYIAIVDADDIVCEGRLIGQLKFLEHYEDVWCVGGFAEKIDYNGRSLGIMDYPPKHNQDIIRKIIADPTSNPIIDPTTMFRKSDFYDLGGYSFKEDRNLVADMDLWFRALLSDKVFVNMPEVFIKYRINPKGNTRSHQKEMIRQHVTVRNEFIKGI